MSEIDRRDFLKLVGVSAGAATAAGCSDPVEKLIPYVVQPEEITPGIPVYYASTCTECPAACGLHVKTREGRPVKLEGNPDHPINQGSLCARGQASIAWNYHPDRFRGPKRRNDRGDLEDISWEEATALLAQKIGAARESTILLGGSVGPTASELLDHVTAAAGLGGRIVYEPFTDHALRNATEAVFGAAAVPAFDLSSADLVIDFGSDFLETGASPTEMARQFAASRDVSGESGRAARFVYVGPRLSMTASSADEWIPAKPGTEGILALGIARVAAEQGAISPDELGLVGGLLENFDLESTANRTGVEAKTIQRLGRALAEAKAAVALPPGVALSSRRARDTASAVLVLNHLVGAVGSRMHLLPASGGRAPATQADVQRQLIQGMSAGKVQVLLVHDSNPVYSLPGFAEALGKVGFLVSFASVADETSEQAHLILPDHSSLESWGDAEPRPGVRSLIQPTIQPLFGTRQIEDTLLEVGRALGGETAERLPEGSFRDVLRNAWSGTAFRAALARGGEFAESGSGVVGLAAGAARLDVAEPLLEGDGDLTLVAYPSPHFYDGRSANLPWLQEVADPVTKIAWTSWAEISSGTARKLGVGVGDVVAVETPAGRIELPAYPRGGLRDDVVAIPIGQGHTAGKWASRTGDGMPGEARGVSVLSVLPEATDEAGSRAWLATKAKVSSTGRFERVASWQHTDNKRGRQLGEAVSLAALAAGGVSHFAADSEGAAHEGGHGESHEIRLPYDPADDSLEESLHRWGMAIDLDRCTGCNACVTACYVENNIPIVGEQESIWGRHMPWIRIERFIGDGEPELEAGNPRPRSREQLGDVDVRNSPMLCQQCGAAPCEPVCPVIATYHNPEGLNGMIYNRCIGTRYCSNNCPYKVRRFNYWEYGTTHVPESMHLMLNPDVTVRGQGVMEKCTFCVQRIESARQKAKDEGRPIGDGEVKTACQQACPSQAITFGNLKDDGSAVSKKADDAARGYHALHVLNTRPAVTYLAKVKRGSVEG